MKVEQIEHNLKPGDVVKSDSSQKPSGGKSNEAPKKKVEKKVLK